MPAFCHQCGAQLQPGSKYCSECGVSIAVPSPTPEVARTRQPGTAPAIAKPHKSEGVQILKLVLSIFLIGVVAVLVLVAVTSGHDQKSPTTDTQPQSDAATPSTQSANEEKPFDYSKPAFTKYGTIVCPISLLYDPSENHSPEKVAEMFNSLWNKADKAKELGCEELQEGIPIYASKLDDEMASVSLSPNGGSGLFTLKDELTNKVPGQSDAQKVELASAHIYTSPTAPLDPASTAPSTPGAIFVSMQSRNPISTGNVKVKGDLVGFGAIVCPDNDVFTAWMNSTISSKSDETPDEEHGHNNNGDPADLKQLARFGCSYFPPGTPMVSEGPNQYGSLAVVMVNTPDGKVIKGVTFPSSITPIQQ